MDNVIQFMGKNVTNLRRVCLIQFMNDVITLECYSHFIDNITHFVNHVIQF